MTQTKKFWAGMIITEGILFLLFGYALASRVAYHQGAQTPEVAILPKNRPAKTVTSKSVPKKTDTKENKELQLIQNPPGKKPAAPPVKKVATAPAPAPKQAKKAKPAPKEVESVSDESGSTVFELSASGPNETTFELTAAPAPKPVMVAKAPVVKTAPQPVAKKKAPAKKNPGNKANKVVFSLNNAAAKSVKVDGGFVKRIPRALQRREDGIWTLTLYITPGTYTYSYIVDGKRILDPDNPLVDPAKGENIILVEPRPE